METIEVKTIQEAEGMAFAYEAKHRGCNISHLHSSIRMPGHDSPRAAVTVYNGGVPVCQYVVASAPIDQTTTSGEDLPSADWEDLAAEVAAELVRILIAKMRTRGINV